MRLIVEFGGERREYRLREGATIIGRDPSCDIVLSDPRLSRRHLECSLEGDRLLIRDLRTRNGTFLGARRIEEAHLPPGVSLRVGSATLRFEPDEQPSDTKAVPLPRARPAQPRLDLESQVPVSEHYEEDEEPTPVVQETPPPPAGGAEEARVVVRDNRWYLRDPATGAEVEIVPVQRGDDSGAAQPAFEDLSAGAPEAAQSREISETRARAPVEAQLPARIARGVERFPSARPAAAPRLPGQGAFRAIWSDPKRRVKFLLAAFAAVLLITIVAVVLHKPQNQVPPITREQYRQRADAVLAAFAKAADDASALTAAGKNDESAQLVAQAGGTAVENLRLLQKEPVEGKPKLAQMMIESLQADTAAVKDFSTAWPKAQQRWEEVVNSSESTQTAVALARARLAWIEGETTDMTALEDARLSLSQGDALKAIQKAADISKTGPFRKDADLLIQQATDAALRAAEAPAAAQRWTDAIASLNALLKVRPDMADSLAPKIALYEQRERERLALEQAAKLSDDRQYDEAARLLAQIPADSPYAQQAAALQDRFKQKQVVQVALALFAAGNGPDALSALSNLNLKGSPDLAAVAARIKAVMDDKTRALAALKANRFEEVKEALDGILALEPDQNNVYVRDAKAEEARLPDLIRAAAQVLVDPIPGILKSDEDRKYHKALGMLEEAHRLDPANKGAQKYLKELELDAYGDYTRALQMPRGTPAERAEVLRVLKDARDRLSMNDKLYPDVTREINALESRPSEPAGSNP